MNKIASNKNASSNEKEQKPKFRTKLAKKKSTFLIFSKKMDWEKFEFTPVFDESTKSKTNCFSSRLIRYHANVNCKLEPENEIPLSIKKNSDQQISLSIIGISKVTPLKNFKKKIN